MVQILTDILLRIQMKCEFLSRTFFSGDRMPHKRITRNSCILNWWASEGKRGEGKRGEGKLGEGKRGEGKRGKVKWGKGKQGKGE